MSIIHFGEVRLASSRSKNVISYAEFMQINILDIIKNKWRDIRATFKISIRSIK